MTTDRAGKRPRLPAPLSQSSIDRTGTPLAAQNLHLHGKDIAGAIDVAPPRPETE